MITLYFVNKQFINSERLTREILGEYLNVDGGNLVIQTNKYGKPYLKDYLNLHYNISHTTGSFICALTNGPVGVDIEMIKKFNKRIVNRFFATGEQEYIFACDENQDERFAIIWTRKEAYVKFIGKGMTIPFESFDVLKLDKKVVFSTFNIGSYILSLCVSKGTFFKSGKHKNKITIIKR